MYIGDFIQLVDKYINNNYLPRELDCVYDSKYKLSDIAKVINKLSSHKVDINIVNSDLGLSYSGWYHDLKVDYIGLESGIKKVYESLL
jgi:hypothetical protein